MNEAAPEAPAPEAPAPALGRLSKSLTENGLSRGLIGVAILLWLGCAVIGTLGQSLERFDHEASISYQGEGVDNCAAINPSVVDGNPALATQWCTPTQVLGPRLPEGVDFYTGDIAWGEVGWSEIAEALGQPDLWLTLGVGGSALLVFVAFSRQSGTVRAGLAASISIVFLGLLLFPTSFTWRIPADMRLELINAWKWIIVFYFGSEAAVQAWKVANPGSAGVAGDVPQSKPTE